MSIFYLNVCISTCSSADSDVDSKGVKSDREGPLWGDLLVHNISIISHSKDKMIFARLSHYGIECVDAGAGWVQQIAIIVLCSVAFGTVWVKSEFDFCSPRVVCAMAHSADNGDVYPLDVLMDLPISHKKKNTVRLVIFINFYVIVNYYFVSSETILCRLNSKHLASLSLIIPRR